MKRILPMLVCIAMVLGMMIVPAAAVDTPTPTVTVQTVTDEAQPGDTVTLAVSIANNTGFCNFEWTVVYDESKLELEAINATYIDEDGEEVPYISGALVVANAETGRITCARVTNSKRNNVLFYLDFIVKSVPEGGFAEVKIESDMFDAIFDGDYVACDASFVAGGVNVAADPTGDDNTGDDNTGDDNTGGSTTGGSTTGGSTTGGSTTGGSTTGGSTTGGSTTGGETIDFNVIDMTDGNTPDTTGAIWEFTMEDDAVTMTVTHDKACVVVIWDGENYIKLNASENADGGYDYDVSAVAAGADIIIAVKGDTSGDGVANSTDARQIVVAANGGTPLSALAAICADTSGDGVPNATDARQIVVAANGGNVIKW